MTDFTICEEDVKQEQELLLDGLEEFLTLQWHSPRLFPEPACLETWGIQPNDSNPGKAWKRAQESLREQHSIPAESVDEWSDDEQQ